MELERELMGYQSPSGTFASYLALVGPENSPLLLHETFVKRKEIV
jgi:hypothetical protein